jgi:hypothetical protein
MPKRGRKTASRISLGAEALKRRIAMSLRDAIYTRRAVRKYLPELPSEELQNEALKVAREADAIEGQKARYELAMKGSVTGSFAPCNILGYCDGSDAAMANVGYQLQKADLFLQEKGLGSVWLASGKPKTDKKGFGMLLAFGKTEAPPRTGEKDFHRLSVGEISNENNAVANAVRLAPSAANTQPWQLVFSPGKLVVKYKGRGPMQLMLKKMNKLDIGIAARHAVVELESQGKKIVSVAPEGDGNSFSVVIRYE